ncbi:MAG TPA: DNA repair protein RadA, partial [Armatimonadetes bacterium]|nr:DNA repair protein RadA [Armatimonadota bacterium]
MKKGNRSQTIYRCQECGYQTLQWRGQCPDCGAWNTIHEELIATSPRPDFAPSRGMVTSVHSLPTVNLEAEPRLSTGLAELDRVLGGGLVPGSVVLLGGEPGVGKSTLLLQVVATLSAQGCRCLYISGEESPQQIRRRAERLRVAEAEVLLLAETDLETVAQHLEERQPQVVVIDSIQTMSWAALESAPGTVTQVRECTAYLSRLAKATSMTFLLVGHVTKEGALAGPKVMEHIVDTVLYFEGDRSQTYQVLRAIKNRFGSTNEIGLFEMQETGLAEVSNPSQALLSQRPLGMSGTVVVCTLEGTRPLLVEVQALVAPSYFGMPRRTASGFDYNRMCLLLAVLEKRGGLNLAHKDVYVNVVGGIRVTEPAADLGVVLAVASSYYGLPIDPELLVFGEVGLAG